MNLERQNNSHVLSSSSSLTVFDSYKPPISNSFNQNSSLILLLNRLDNQQNSEKAAQNSQDKISALFPNKITILYKQPDKISSHLNCPICYQIYLTPTRLYCGHTFCYKCLQTIFDGDKVGGSRLTDDRTCPICRVVIDKNKVGKDLIAESIIDEIIVVCPREDCPWEGMQKDLEVHYRNQCVFEKSQKEKPLWHSVFPEHAPKENVQVDPVVKGSLIARIYAKNKQLQEKSTFQQLKKNLNDQSSSNQANLSKRQQMLLKQKEKESKQLNGRIQARMKQLQDFEQFCRQKTPQELQKQYQELQKKKDKQKRQKRKKNMHQLQKILKEKEYQTLQEDKKMQKEKQVYLQKQRLKDIQIQQNFNLKLNCLQRLLSFKNTKTKDYSNDDIPTSNSSKSNKDNCGKNNDRKPVNQSGSAMNVLGVFRKKPSFSQYMQKVRENKNFKPYVEPQHSEEPPKIYDRGMQNVKFTYDVCQPHNPRYAEPKVIVPSPKQNQKSSYLATPNVYQATYEKHRLVRRPYIPPTNQDKIPQKIPHRYYTSIDQFSDPSYLSSDKANRRGEYAHLESTKKHIGVSNMQFKPS